MTKKLQDAVQQQKNQSQQAPLQIYGLLGLPLDGSRKTEVPNRNSYVFVRLRNNQSEVIQAFNNKVAPAYNLPVIVQREGNRYSVVSVDTQRYENNWNSFAPYLPRHGNTHSFDPDSGGGGDITFVHGKQFMPLLVFPSGSDGGPNVIMASYTLKKDNNTWMYVGNTGTPNLTPYIPTGSNAVMVLVYLDTASGNPYLLAGTGTYFANTITGTAQVVPYIPALTDPTAQIPLAAIRLVTGTDSIGWANIYDVRQYLHPVPTGTGAAASLTIQDEGVSQGSASTLNFVGANVEATVAGGIARIFITGSTGGASTGTMVNIWDEGVLKGTADTLNVVGAVADISVSGTVARLFITGSTGGSSFTGDTGTVVLTDQGGALTTNTKLKWQLIGGDMALWFGSDIAGQDANANRIGSQLFDAYFDILGAGTGGQRTVQIYDILRTPALTIPGLANNLVKADSNGTFISGEAPLSSGTYGRRVRDWIEVTPLNGWMVASETWTRTGNHQFTISGDLTAKYRKGTKIRYVDNSGVEYGVIGSSSHAGGTTTVNMIPNTSYTMDTGPMSDRHISYIENPEGWPQWFSFTTPTMTCSGAMTWTTTTTVYAMWRPIGTDIEVTIFLIGTTGGTASNKIYAAPPIAISAGSALSSAKLGITQVRDGAAGSSVVGSGFIDATNGITMYKANDSNFGLGASNVVIWDGIYPY